METEGGFAIRVGLGGMDSDGGYSVVVGCRPATFAGYGTIHSVYNVE